MRFLNLRAEIAADKVLKKIKCTPDSELYEDFLGEYEEILGEMEALVEPVSAMAFGKVPEEAATEEIPAGSRVVYVITHIGEAICQYSQKFFAEGDFVKGMLVDAYADTYLFELEKSWSNQLVHRCKEAGVGISKRLEVPGDLTMEIQKAAFDAIGAENLPGSKISDRFMFYPVKTLCQVFLVTDDTNLFRVGHNCRLCSNTGCSMRDVKPVQILVRSRQGDFEITCEGNERILDSLQKAKEGYTAVCGKAGRCGKCKIRVISGEVAVSAEDKSYFEEEELREGYRLSCKAYPQSDCEIELFFDREEFEVLSDGIKKQKSVTSSAQGYGIAIDIGTTTIAGQILCLADGNTEATAVSLNHQRDFGADVISRIQASNQGKAKELQASIRKDLAAVIAELLEKSKVNAKEVVKVTVAGNTTMGHLLMGYSCETLGRLPFKPVNIEEIHGTAEEILGEQRKKSGLQPESFVCLLPGISVFVGADILAGLLCNDFEQKEKVSFFLDLGTNGEMAVGNKDKLLVTSTAAGPAFEGGNIQWGRGSVPGAICHVEILEDESCKVETIGGKEPTGICGSGLIEAVAELLRCELLDETGRLDGKYAETGFPLAKTADGEPIVLTQKDIRELQLAKAAVRAGIEILLQKYDVSYEELETVYLAGGFGHGIDQKKAAEIGLIPEEFLDRIAVVGNSSLSGARQYLLQKEASASAAQLRKVSQEVSLASEKAFQEVYVDAMYFE